jgi:hypothetical protein
MYLDFGGALAAIGLFFTVYQLRQPSWDVVLRLRPWWQRRLPLTLALLGALLVLFAVLLDDTKPSWPIAALANPFVYQVGAYIAFALAPVFLLVFATVKRGLFSERRANHFYNVLAWHVATTGERIAILDVLMANFSKICQVAVLNDEKRGSGYATAIVDVILSDEIVVRELTTNRLAMLDHVIAVSKARGLSRRQARLGIPAIVRNLFVDPNSFLYKQYETEGLALAMNVYDELFASPEMLSRFELFSYPTLDYAMRERVGGLGLQVFLKCLTTSLRTYLKTGRVPAAHVNAGIKYLSEIFGNACLQIALGQSEAPNRTSAWDAISRIGSFLGHRLLFIEDLQNWNPLVRANEKLASGEGFYSQTAAAPAIAECISDALSGLAQIDKKVDFERCYMVVVELLHGVMDRAEESMATYYAGNLTERIWEEIKKNVVRRHFPAVLRVYLNYIGFALVFDRDLGAWVGREKERMRRLLYVDLAPLFDRGERMINDDLMQDELLPPVMSYRDGRFWYRSSYGKGSEHEIAMPPPASPSALEDVKDEFDRWEETTASARRSAGSPSTKPGPSPGAA